MQGDEKTALTSKMGLCVGKAFGPKMEHLMRMQLAFDLVQARKAERRVRVKRYVAKREGIIGEGPGKKRAGEWTGRPRMTGWRDG